MIVQLRRAPLRQIVVTKGSSRQLSEIRRDADILDTVQVPSRFHGLVVEYIVLGRIAPWRVTPSVELISRRRTKTWTADAPTVSLAQSVALAATHIDLEA